MSREPLRFSLGREGTKLQAQKLQKKKTKKQNHNKTITWHLFRVLEKEEGVYLVTVILSCSHGLDNMDGGPQLLSSLQAPNKLSQNLVLGSEPSGTSIKINPLTLVALFTNDWFLCGDLYARNSQTSHLSQSFWYFKCYFYYFFLPEFPFLLSFQAETRSLHCFFRQDLPTTTHLKSFD